MIDIYAFYTKNSNGTINTGRTLIQSVPALSEANINLVSPTTKGDLGNAGSMEFTVHPGTPFYDAFLEMRTYILINYDGEAIFYGRVLSPKEGFRGDQKYSCEGALAFFNDSYFPPKAKNSRPNISINEFLNDILTNHNNQLNDPLRTIHLGEVPGNYTNATSSEQRIDNASREFGTSGWENTKSALEDLKSHYGGAFRIRVEIDNDTQFPILYLDWYKHYYRSTVNTQTVEVAKNIIDVSKAGEISSIFTAIIPIGKTSSGDDPIYLTGYRNDIHDDNYLTVPQICKSLYPNSFYTDNQLDSGYHTANDYKTAVDKYGLIFKTVEIQEAHSQEQLLTKAAEWIKDNYQGGVTSFSVKAVDLHFIGENTDKILLGDRVSLTYRKASMTSNNTYTVSNETKILTCTSISYDIFNPANNQYTFGIPANMLGKMYGENSAKKTKASGYTPPKKDENPDPEDDGTAWLKAVFNWLEGHKVWYISNNLVESGPRVDRKRNYFWMPTEAMQDGETIWELANPHIASINNGVITWQRDGQGRPMMSWTSRKKSEFTLKSLELYHIFEYVKDEYNFDLRSGLTIKMPSVITDEDGNLAIFTGVLDDSGGIQKLAEYLKGQEVLNIFDRDGKTIGRFLGTNGDYLFAELNPDGSIKLDNNGNPVLISTRDLKVQIYNTDRKVGYFVTEDSGGELGFNNENVKLVGEMSLGIEEYYQGKLVVARESGDLVYLGTQDIETDGGGEQHVVTRNLTAASLNHMDLVCGDITYEIDPNTGVKYTVVNSGGGVRVHRGLIDPTTGEYIRDDHGQIVRSEFGLYDDNNLTAGVMITKINNDETHMKIGADHLDIDGITIDVTAEQLATFGVWMDSNSDTKVGLAVQKINNGTIGTKLSGNAVYIGGDPTATLESKISAIDSDLLSKGITITNISSDVTTIGNGLTQAQADIAAQGRSITAINTDITNINSSVTTIGGEVTQAQADIAANGQSITAINSDIVDITGELNAAKARIRTIESDYITTTSLSSNIANIASRIFVGQSGHEETGLNVRSTLVLGDLVSVSSSTRITASTPASGVYLKNMIVGASVNQSTNTLTLTPLSGDPITFSKATQLSGSWSGNTYTVTASPQGNQIATQTFTNFVGWGGTDWGTSSDKGKAKAQFTYFNNGVQTEILPITINANSKLQEKGPGSVKISSNGTYYPTDDKIGFKYVIVDVADSGSYDAGWAAAQSKVTLPSSGTSNSYIEFKYPPSTVDGSALNKVYAIINDSNDNNSVLLSNNGTTYAKFTHNKYSDGWSGCYATVGLDNTAEMTLAYGGSVTVKAQAKRTSTAGSKTDVATRIIRAPAKPNTTGSWSSGTYTVTGGANTLTTTIQTLTPTGSVTRNGSTVTRTFKAQYGVDENHLYDTGFSAPVSIDASSVWNAGGNTGYVAYVTNPTIPSGTTPTELSYGTNYKFYARYTNSSGSAADATGNSSYSVRYFKTKADRYETGWAGCYATVGLDSTTATTLGYGESITVYAQAKATSGASNKTNKASRKITAPVDRYNTGYNDGSAAGVSSYVTWLATPRPVTSSSNTNGIWFGYTTNRGSNYASFISPSYPESGKRRYIYGNFKESNGTQHNVTANTWYVPEPWLFPCSGAGSHDQGTLAANSYICIGARGYNDSGSYVEWKNPDYTWKVPGSSGASYSFSGLSKGGGITDVSGTTGALAGYTTHQVSSGSMGGTSAQSQYRYVKFTVDGRRHAFYWV